MDEKAIYELKNQWSLVFLSDAIETYVNDKSLKTYSYSFLLLAPGTRRTFHFPDNYKHRTIHFEWDCEAFHSIDEYIQYPVQNGLFYEALFDKAISSFMVEDTLYTDLVVWQILLELLKQPRVKEDRNKKLVERAIEIFHQNLSETISIANLAKELGVSHNQLTKIFKKSKDSTPLEFVNKVKAEQSYYHLTQSNLSIKEIAISVGFMDLANFNKFIKKHFGQSPTEIRIKNCEA